MFFHKNFNFPENAASFGYDAVGARTNLTVPGVLSVGYAYDEMNRLTEILGNGNATHFAYDATGQRTNAIWPNGTTAAYAYDDAGQLLSLVHRTASGTPIASFEYAYDAAGNRTNMTTLEGLHAFSYDNRNQLVGAVYPDGSSEEFVYDLVGNRTSLVAVSTNGATNTTFYTYASGNRLIADASETATNTYAYDGAGRLTNHVVNGQTRTFTYDFTGRMTSLTDIDGSTFAYEFDGEGNRLSQLLNDCLSKRFVYDGADVLLELNPTNGVAYAWVNGPGIDQPIERLLFIDGAPRARRVFHADALGSIAALTDPNGLVTQTYAYSAFGSLRHKTGPDPNRVTYTGREQLGDSQGCMYYRFRSYNPLLGRFSSIDPMEFINGGNPFIYALANPLLLSDPFGLETQGDCWTGLWDSIGDPDWKELEYHNFSGSEYADEFVKWATFSAFLGSDLIELTIGMEWAGATIAKKAFSTVYVLGFDVFSTWVMDAAYKLLSDETQPPQCHQPSQCQ